MKARDIAEVIEGFAPLSLQESWDNSGFTVGDPDQEVSSVLVGFDPTPELVEEAVNLGANMIITHHPLIFSGVKKISPADPVGQAIMSAIKNDIIIYGVHTNIDKVVNGVSGLVAKKIGLGNVEILVPDADGFGLGVVGDLQEPQTEEDFILCLKDRFAVGGIRTSKKRGRMIKRVAICGGSGRSLINAGISSGADVFITGDVSYHDFLSYPDIFLADIGHFESEIDVVNLIYSILLEKIPNFALQISKNNNPVYYY